MKRLPDHDIKLFKASLKDVDAALAGKRTKSFGPFELAPKATSADVKAARLAARRSQPLFAAALGLSAATVRAWEGGRRRPGGLESKVIRAIVREPKFLGLLAQL